MSFATWEGDHLILSLYIVPNSKRNEVVGPYQNALKLKIMAIAQDNQANHAVAELLSQWFKVPKRKVLLLKGQQSRLKQFRIVSPQEIPTWLNDDK